MLLPTIYKRTETGKIQVWTMEVEGDKFRTVAGQLNGKLVTAKWTTAKGKNPGKKNATTPEEQALKEANAKRTLKLEAEYREKIEDIDDPTIWKDPLLAQEFFDDQTKKEIELVYPVWSQPKLDGMRCITMANASFSREGNPIMVIDHIRESIAAVFAKYPNLELDGELYNHDLKANFDELISIAKKGKATPERIAIAKEKIQYWIYDIRDPSMSFEERSQFILKLFLDFPEMETYCRIVPTDKIEDRKDLDLCYKDYQDQGYEGQMIRLNTKYEYKRTYNLLKRKEFIDREFIPIDVLEGKGNRSGMAGKMVFEIDGKRFEANMRGNAETYKEILENKNDYIGKRKATLRFQNYTPDGIPRFPVVTCVNRDYE